MVITSVVYRIWRALYSAAAGTTKIRRGSPAGESACCLHALQGPHTQDDASPQVEA